jgi:hypothetical protein
MNVTKCSLLTIALLIASMSSGCAHLGVEVDILDERFWLSSEWLIRERATQVQQTYYQYEHGALDDAHDKVMQGVRSSVAAAVDRLSSGDKAVIALETKTRVGDALMKYVNTDVDVQVRGELAAIQEAVRSAYKILLTPPTKCNTRDDIVEEAWTEYAFAEKQLDKLPDTIYALLSRDLRTGVAAPPTSDTSSQESAAKSGQALAQAAKVSLDALGQAGAEAKDRIATDAKTNTEVVVKGLIGNKSIFNDPFASAVVNAPECYWKGQFNKTYGCGTLGDIDIAIKMEDVANFTVKGVRNDAAAITRATFAVGQQAVQTVAALYGIPIPKPGQSTPATDAKGQPAILPPDIGSPRVRTATAVASEDDVRRARSALFEALMAQQANLSGNADQVKKAVAAMKTATTDFVGAVKD